MPATESLFVSIFQGNGIRRMGGVVGKGEAAGGCEEGVGLSGHFIGI